LRAAAAGIEPFGVSEGKTTRVGYGAAVASREFRAIFAGQLVSVAGTSVAAVALTIVVFRRTDSPLLASLTFALGFLPYLLGGGLLSSIVDRVRPRRLVVASDTASAVLGALMAWPAIPVPILFALLLAIGTLSSMSGGARAALVRSSVSDEAYVPARSLMRIASQFAQIGGNACGGVLLILLTTSGALLVNAASFAFSAAVVRLVVADYPNVGERTQAALLRDSLHGARSVFAHAQLRRLLLVGWLAPMFAVAPEAVAAPYVAHHHGPSAQVGLWLVALPLGIIAGDIFGVRFLTAHQQRVLMAPAAVASFAPYLAFVLDPRFPIAVGLLVTSGACGLYSLGLDARVRDAAPPRLFARAMTLNSAGLMTLQGVGFTLAGAVAQGVGASTAIAIAGGCGIVSTVVLLRPDRRSTASHAPETPRAEAQAGSG
jgi:MFS family permease